VVSAPDWAAIPRRNNATRCLIWEPARYWTIAHLGDGVDQMLGGGGGISGAINVDLGFLVQNGRVIGAGSKDHDGCW